VSGPASGALNSYRETSFPPGATVWRDAVFSVVDLETTGLNPASDEIISFGTVTVAGGRIRLDDARYELVRPTRMPNADTIRIHGLREVDLADARPLSEQIDGLLAALTGRALVAHVAAVERGFLTAALSGLGLKLRNPVLDTAAMARELRRLRGDHRVDDPVGLSDLARSLGLPVHRPHHADGDALTTAQAFIALATHFEAFEDPLTLGRLQEVSESPDGQAGAGAIRRLIRRLRL
jgi:DNA polymerase-3 subunit epsilon